MRPAVDPKAAEAVSKPESTRLAPSSAARSMLLFVNETHTGAINATPAMVRPAPARNIPAPIHPILAVLVMMNLQNYDSAPGPDVTSAVLLVLFLLLAWYSMSRSNTQRKHTTSRVDSIRREGRDIQIGG
jgi:hypothetical protein